jgi:hypothetical protein
MTEWICLGGPIHGEYRPAGAGPIAVPEGLPARVEYATEQGRTTVVIPPRPAIYYPTAVAMPGWRIKLDAWVEAHVATGTRRFETGAVFPGGLQGVPRPLSDCCRWCYGRALGQLGVCVRDECISAVSWLESMDSFRWTT